MAARPRREPITFTVRFPLKPYLHDFVSSIAGGPAYCVTQDNRLHVLTDYVRIGLGRHIKHPQHFQKYRLTRIDFDVLISERMAERYGVEPRHYARMEQLVEHLFYHMLLAHVEAQKPDPRQFRRSVRDFMDQHDVGGENVDYETLARIVQRKRARRAT